MGMPLPIGRAQELQVYWSLAEVHVSHTEGAGNGRKGEGIRNPKMLLCQSLLISLPCAIVVIQLF